jgi:hypothetical protein
MLLKQIKKTDMLRPFNFDGRKKERNEKDKASQILGNRQYTLAKYAVEHKG